METKETTANNPNPNPNPNPNLNSASTPKPPFEASLEQLQTTVKKLESGELSLEDSLKHFEEGVRLTRICQEYLAAAEQRVELLMKVGTDGNGAGTPVMQPFPSNSAR